MLPEALTMVGSDDEGGALPPGLLAGPIDQLSQPVVCPVQLVVVAVPRAVPEIRVAGVLLVRLVRIHVMEKREKPATPLLGHVLRN